MTELQALLIAVLQGATELFPVSSLGHAVIVPAVLGWQIDQHGAAFLPFLVLLHCGTAAALLLYFWRDWIALGAGVLGLADSHRVRESRHVLLLLIVATIPAVLIGGALEHALRTLFASPLSAAGFLVANGALLLAGEALRRRGGAATRLAIAQLGFADALIIGLWQCLALLPGISRSGATITGGLLRGIDHATSAHFSFLIATPVILAATALETVKLLHAPVAPGTVQIALVAAVVAGLVAFLSTAFLMRYFRRHEQWALNPFAIYCFVVGGAAAAWFTLR